MGNKQEGLETMAQLGMYALIAITETWWGKSHNGPSKQQNQNTELQENKVSAVQGIIG